MSNCVCFSTFAQSTSLRLSCPAQASNVAAYKKAIEAKVKASFDANLYSSPKVNASFRLVNREKGAKLVNVDNVIDGLTLTAQALSVLASGTLKYQDSCEYTYVLKLKIRATEIASGQKLSSSTESVIKITSSVESAVH